MQQTIKVYTPEFLKKVGDYIQLIADAMSKNPLLVSTNWDVEDLPYRVQECLEAYYDGRDIMPDALPQIPEELQTPEFVLYTFDSSEIGQPLLPTMIPSSFKPSLSSTDKLEKLRAYVLECDGKNEAYQNAFENQSSEQ